MDRPTERFSSGDALPAKPPATLILDYATPAADGVPEWLPDVDAAIDRSETLKRLAARIDRTDVAAQYLERAIARRFAADVADGRCANCDAPASLLAVVGWSFRIKGRSFAVRPRNDEASGIALTHHAVCDACGQRWSTRVAPIARVRRVANWTGIGSAILAFIGVVIANVVPRAFAGVFYAPWVPLLACLFVGAVGRAIESCLMPRAIPPLMPRWLKYNSLVTIADRLPLKGSE